MQNSLSVAIQLSYFGAFWVFVHAVADFPQAELVFRKSMRAQNLFIIPVPYERAHLTLRVYSVDQLAALAVPEPHRLVGRPSASCQ